MELLIDEVHDVDAVFFFFVYCTELVLVSFDLSRYFIRRSKVNVLRFCKHFPCSRGFLCTVGQHLYCVVSAADLRLPFSEDILFSNVLIKIGNALCFENTFRSHKTFRVHLDFSGNSVYLSKPEQLICEETDAATTTSCS